MMLICLGLALQSASAFFVILDAKRECFLVEDTQLTMSYALPRIDADEHAAGNRGVRQTDSSRSAIRRAWSSRSSSAAMLAKLPRPTRVDCE
jgi:hypothetical protein